MLGHTILLGAALVLCSLQAAAFPVRVEFEWPAGMPATAVARVHIRAIQTASSTDSAVPVEASAALNGAVLNLNNGVWQVQASAPGYWSQEKEIAVGRQSPDLQLSLWPAASLHGEILTTEGDPLPRALVVRLSATPASIPHSPPHAELLCPIEKGSWSCEGPVGLFDMRLDASGYAPRYEWGINLKPAEDMDLGRTVLRRVASVFGRAIRKDGTDPPGPCRAILRPDVERHGPGDPDAPTSDASFSVPLTPRGYFQVVGVQPGPHLLDVVCAGASGLREFGVQAEGETRIDPPMRLEDLTLDIAVAPKVDPEGRPWLLTVDMTAPRYRRVANKAATTADGSWLRHGLMTGSYRVSISSTDGTRWLQRDFNLAPGNRPLILRLASVRVAGRVRLSSQPVGARLVFFNDAAGASVLLKSNADGRFEGLLPVTPNVRETSNWTVEAHVARPPVSQRLLGVSVPIGSAAPIWLDLELPTVAVRGSVVSAEGQPQHDIQVTFENSGGVRTTTSTDDAGNFEMPDLPPGKYAARADSPEGSSDRTPFDVVEGIESDVKLVLNPSMHATFYVVSSNGPVSNAAVQVWIAPGVPRAFAHTDQEGRFEAGLPPGTTEVGMTVGAAGYALKLIRMKVPSDDNGSPDSANTITLDDSGGKLVMNVQPAGRSRDSAGTLYLVHDGAIQEALTVAGWGTDKAGSSGNGPAVVGAIDPGKYALCLLTDAAQLSALWSGPLPSDRCRIGSVEQGETLTLSPR
jgi:hypothetical protein